jgi:monoamine oxidase
MYFAGEHTCAGFWGYMEGALRSGMLAAERVQKAIASSR